MPTDQATTDAYERLKTDAKGRAASLVKIRGEMKSIPLQLAAAMKNADALEIEAVGSAVEAEISFIERELMIIKISMEDIHTIEKDRSFIVAHLAEFRKLLEGVSGMRKELLKQLGDARALKKKAGDAESAQQDTQDDALAELAAQEAQFDAFRNMDKRLADARLLLKAALNDVASRDAKGLKDDQQAAAKLNVSGAFATLDRIESEVNALVEKYQKKGFEDAVMKKIAQQAKGILTAVAATRKTMNEIENVRDMVDQLEIPGIDCGNAAKTLGITDKALLVELDKILKGNFGDVEKKLDGLGQKMTPKGKGKAMLMQLQKAHVV